MWKLQQWFIISCLSSTGRLATFWVAKQWADPNQFQITFTFSAISNLFFTHWGRHDTQHNDIQHNDTQHKRHSVVYQQWVPSCWVSRFSFVMLSVIMQSVVMPIVIVLYVVAPHWQPLFVNWHLPSILWFAFLKMILQTAPFKPTRGNSGSHKHHRKVG